MNIIEMYKKYAIPVSLQMHMLRVAALANLILDNWQGEKIDKEKLLRILLMHDMGNIVKIPEEEIKEETFLKQRKEWIEKYGADDHKISEVIARQEGLTEEEIKIMQEKIFMNNEAISQSESYLLKIAAYCDQRVAPDGVKSLEDRMQEGKQRYKNRPGTSFNNPLTDKMIAYSLEIEKQIMQYCKLKKEELDDKKIASYIENLKMFEIK